MNTRTPEHTNTTSQKGFYNQYLKVFPLLAVVLLAVALLSIILGAVQISFDDMYEALRKTFTGSEALTLDQNIFIQLRLPRVLLSIITGAALACSGVLMQALFRNPIVEPGLVGTSSGAAFGAALYFVLGATFKFNAGEWTLPIAAFIGGLASTWLVYVLSYQKQQAGIVTLLLTGIAINALFFSGVGFMAYLARDPQARSITFWNLGTLSGANWHSVIICLIVVSLSVFYSWRKGAALNTLMLGENEAAALGVNVQRLKRNILLLNVLMVAVTTAFTGVISFVGLIVPHLLRFWRGSDNRFLLLGSCLLGPILLTSADLTARLLLAPAELPIGIVTSVVGVPVFLFMMRKQFQYLKS